MQTELSKAEPPKRKRRWFQFSLRTLLIFTLICAIPCAWLGSSIERKRQEREAVDAIAKLGGYAYYDYAPGPTLPLSGPFLPKRPPPGPDWLRNLLGENYFSEVDRVSLRGHVMADADLACLTHFPHLRKLTVAVNDPRITDAGLASIQGLTQLQQLTLMEPNVTDAGLVFLNGLTQLQRLALRTPKITDAGLVNLKGLTQLQTLDLIDANVTDAGVADLQSALPNCEISR